MAYRLTSTGIVLGGNLNDFISSSRAELAHNGPKWGIFSGTSYTYKNRDHEITANDATSRNILSYGQRRRLYPFVIVSIAKSLRRGIDFQYQLGPGAAYRVFGNQQNYLRIGSAVIYESSHYAGNNFENYDGTSHIINKWRLLTFVAGTQTLPGNRMRIVYEVSWQPAFQGPNNRVYALAGAEIPISRKVSLRGNLEYTHENVVLVEKSKYDFIVSFGLTLTNIFKNRNAEIDED
ncbi:DUF481 domain-containing protein [Larkinella terrae]|uniref:DUF481 domain-containing protein n=1 Tax=Larkinella terrae TaxID=2025311 RepID=A0A7K0EEP8_9BACT|nr:DUF481 domain-containing protein [Larkinella terrae]MRS60294.1 DUF481 domain-containing protein [Larkinella terrae]